ncbi:C40 family peptidase [Bacillus sp. UNCCL81]|uniref:C40 family peptidase n=1 Tax=Bacillus sp. UNCCL81 TaxID=1502755 RepID=UPI0008E01419|nr:C40 family peptidase [Bacillus sp. UNCCL81]SFD71804.1 Cell wall-associated hydrolase, NlpC family [Bacillus sp. UNCCL81]
MLRKKLAVLAMASTIVLSLAPNASVLADSKVETKQAEVDKFQSQFKELSNEIEKIDQQIKTTKQNIEAKKAEISETEEIIKDKNARITYLQDRIQKRNDLLEDRLVAMQKQPKVNLVTDVLFNSDSIVDFFNRVNSISTLFEADENIIKEQKSEQAEVLKEKQLVDEKKASLVTAKEDLVSQQSELSKSQAEKQKSLNTAEANLKLAVKELENAKEDERVQRLEQQSLELAALSSDDGEDDSVSSTPAAKSSSNSDSKSDSNSSSDSNSNSKPDSGSNNDGPVATGGLVDYALQFQGVPYVFGGTSPSGFDCSGFIWYVYSHNGYGISRGNVKTYWSNATKISSPQPGDLVFLQNTYINGPSHMGIYIGGNKMVHAGSKGISVISLSNSWVRSHFLGYGKF